MYGVINNWKDFLHYADLNANFKSPALDDANKRGNIYLKQTHKKITEYQDAIAALEAVQIFICRDNDYLGSNLFN